MTTIGRIKARRTENAENVARFKFSLDLEILSQVEAILRTGDQNYENRLGDQLFLWDIDFNRSILRLAFRALV